MKRSTRSFVPAGLALLLAGSFVFLSPHARSQEAENAWTEADTQLANQYVRLLETRPEYSKVLDLLWEHYRAHDAIELLLGHYKAASEASGAPPQVRLVYAHLLRKKGDFALARLRYEQIVNEPAVRSTVLLGLADIALELLPDPVASEGYLEELAREPGVSADLIRGSMKALADVYVERGNSAAALRVWRRLIERFPEDLGMLQELAGRMIGAGFLDDAIAVYTGLRDDPDPEKRVAVLVELARLYEIANDFDAAAAALNAGLAATHFKHHTHLEFLTLLVRLYERQGRLEELEAVMVAEASRERPAEKALFGLVRFYELTAESSKRQKWLRKLARAVPGNADYGRELVEVLLSNDNYEEAKGILEQFLAGGVEETLPVRLMRVKIELSTAGRDSGSALLREFLAARDLSDQEKADVLAFAEENYLDEIAETLLREELGADAEEAVMRLANLHFLRGRIAEARAVLDQHVALSGDEPAARAERLFKVAAALQNMGLKDAAVEALKESVALQPGELKYLIRLAELLSDAMKIPEAIERFELAWELSTSADDRLDIDQRIFSLLQIADLQGDGMDDEWSGERRPPYGQENLNELSRFLRSEGLTDPAAGMERADGGGRLYGYYAKLRVEALESIVPEVQLRAAWWAHRMNDSPTAYRLLLAFREANPDHVRAERLLLDVAVASGDDNLALRQLDILSKIDGERRMEYALRRAQVRLRQGEAGENRAEALEDLGVIAKDPTTDATILSSLARVYERLGQVTEAKQIYRRAFEKSSLHEKRKLLVELTRLQVDAGAIDEALDTITDLIREEHDILQRRKELSNQVNLAIRHQRLAKLEEDYESLQRKSPLEPFYSEALAQIYENAGKVSEAFTAIKKSYYSARKKDAHLLERMRHLAAETEDVNAAIYYQRQLVAVPDNRAEAPEWHKLISMLELDLQVHEADRIRLRLESKFAQDPEVLQELSRYYLNAREPSAARRVLARMVRLRPWDVTALLSNGILEKEAGHHAEAATLFLQVLAHTQEAADQEAPVSAGKIDRFPLRGFSLGGRPEMLNGVRSLEKLVRVIDDVRVIDNRLRVQVAHYLESGRAEFMAVPDQPDVQRLRAIEELGELVVAPGDPAAKQQWDKYWGEHPPRAGEEAFWVTWCGGDWPRAWDILRAGLADASAGPEELFFCLYGVRMGRMPQLIEWVGEGGSVSGARTRRLGWLLSAVGLFSLDPETRAAEDQLVAFFGNSFVTREHIYSLLKMLNGAGQVHEALRVGEIANEYGRVIPGYFDADLGMLAGAAGDERKQRAYLEEAIGSVNPITSQFQEAIGACYALQETDDQRRALVARVLARFDEMPDNPRAAFGRAWFLALAGENDLAAEACRQIVSLHLDQAKRVGESLTGTFINESSQWMSLFDYAHGARRLGFSEVARGPFSEALDRYDLIAPRLDETAGQFQQFQNYLFNQLLWEFEILPHRERMARLRAAESLFRRPDDKETFARTLAGDEYHREAVMIYRDLLYANPLSNEHARAFLAACESARDDEAALEYIDLLLSGEMAEPEGAVKSDRIRLHAGFLRMARNVDRLKAMAAAQREMGPQLAPQDLHYHRELAALLVEAGQLEDAARIYAEIDDGKHRSVPLLLEHAKVLRDLGREDAAVQILERAEVDRQTLAIDRPIIEALAPLYAATGNRDKLRGLASRALEHQDDGLVITVAAALSAAGLNNEAESLLLLAMRRTGNDSSRLRLVIPAVDLAFNSDSFDRVAPLLEIFFASDHSEARAEQREFIEKIRAAAGGPHAANVHVSLDAAAEATHESVFANVCRLELALASDDAAAPLREIVDRIVRPGAQPEELAMAIESCLEHEAATVAEPILAALRYQHPNLFDNAALSLRVYGALGDEASIASLFNRLSQRAGSTYVPGPTQIEIGDALVAIGETGRAARIYRKFYDRIPVPGAVHRDFVEHYAHFLMDRGEFMAAENVLRNAFRKSAEYDPALIVDLYARQDRLGALSSDLGRFDLSSGLRKRTEFLAHRREAGQDTTTGATPGPP